MLKFRFILLFVVMLTVVGWFIRFIGQQSPIKKSNEVARSERSVSAAPQATGTTQSDRNSRMQTIEFQISTLNQQMQAQQSELRQLAEQISQIFLVLEEQAQLMEDSSKPDNNLEKLSDKSQEMIKREHSSLLAEEINNQFIDSDWSIAAVDQITTVLAKKAFDGSTVVSANCQETLCQIETDHEDEATLDIFMDNFPTLLGWKAHEHTEIINNKNGTITTIVHLSRDGYRLPTANSR